MRAAGEYNRIVFIKLIGINWRKFKPCTHLSIPNPFMDTDKTY